MNKIIYVFLLAYSSQIFSMQLPQQSLVPGGIVVIDLLQNQDVAPRVYFQDRRVAVLKNQGKWVALVGIPLSIKPGKHRILVKYGTSPQQKMPFIVEAKEYPTQYITIKNKRMVNPYAKDIDRIKNERIPINKALRTWTPQTIVDTDFSTPVDGKLSSPFGLRRFFNKQPRKPHSGLDIAAPKGTPIKAPADGVVIESGNFFFNGNSVFLDHGQGLITGYFHMNEIKVKAKQHLKRGDILGTVGETGRVTGPHLHWNVYLNRTKVDPALFIANQLPTNQTLAK